TLDHWSLQAGLALAWLAFWLSTVGREWAFASGKPQPNLIPPAPPPGWVGREIRPAFTNHFHGVSLSTPLAAFILSQSLWHISDTAWGAVCLALCLVFALAARLLFSRDLTRRLAETQVVVAALFFTLALFDFFEGRTLLAALAAQAFAIWLIALRLKDRRIRIASYIYFSVVVLWCLDRIDTFYPAGAGLWSIETVTDYWVATLTLAVATVSRRAIERRFFLFIGFGLLAGIFSRELSGDTLFVTLLIEGLALNAIALALEDKLTLIGAHVFMAGITLIFVVRITSSGDPDTPILNPAFLSSALLPAALVGLARAMPSREARTAHYIIGAIAALALLDAELERAALLFAVTLEALAFIAASRFAGDRIVGFVGDGLFAAAGALLALEISTQLAVTPPFLNWPAAAAGFTLFGALISGRTGQRREYFDYYGIPLHLLFLALVYHQFISVANGHGLISTIWAVYSIGLMVLALRLRHVKLKAVASFTLGVVILKLFLVDLANIEALWRILLFIALGGALLALSYFYQRLWESRPGDSERPSQS
ncbi:MAG TPA: DUF2339 domain-containing protein, partial [candidate division Zixibacteria bacterium]|nr:DUF2339 domain-containing protein [candidate division Zixibacteria bacterium]